MYIIINYLDYASLSIMITMINKIKRSDKCIDFMMCISLSGSSMSATILKFLE